MEVPFHFIKQIFFPKSKMTAALKATCEAAGIWSKIEVVDDTQKRQLEYFEKLFEVLITHPDLTLPLGYCLSIQNRKRNPLWLPHKFKTPGRGTIVFTARGRHMRLMFTDTRDPKLIEGGQALYLIVIGVYENRDTYVKKNTIGGSERKPHVRRDTCPEAMASPQTWGDYWVSINQGAFKMGRGRDPTKGAIPAMCYQDPTPTKFLYFGLSCWESGIEFRNMCIYDC